MVRKQEEAGEIAEERHRRCQMRGYGMLPLARILDIFEVVTSCRNGIVTKQDFQQASLEAISHTTKRCHWSCRGSFNTGA